MKTIDPILQAHLDGGATTMAFCWKVERLDGLVLGFTEHDNDLTFDGVTYLASTGLTASQIQQSLGLSVDNLTLQGALDSDTIKEEDLASGRYDGAAITLYWVNWYDVLDPSQRITLARGNIGQVKRLESTFIAEFRSASAALAQKTGRVYQRYCDAQLGDSRCKIDLTSPVFRATGAVTSVNGRTFSGTGLSTFASNFFLSGVATFTSGANAGLKFEVKASSSSSVTLWDIPQSPVLPGDTFFVTAGCRQDFDVCRTKFNNTINFQGFPHIPGTDLLTKFPGTARPNEKMDGGSLFK